MQYQLDDSTVINFDLNFINDVEVDFDIELPILTISHEETPTISPLEIIDYGSLSIECAFDVTTEQAEEVVKGVLCGTTNPPTFENADYRLLHGQGSMDLAFAGLQNNTEYYLRPYVLSNLGYKYGDVVAQRTKASPIPPEYQLVEWGQPSAVNLYVITSDYTYAIPNLGTIKYQMMPLPNAGRGNRMFGNGTVYRHFTLSNIMYFDVNGATRIQLAINQYLNVTAEWEVGNNYIKRNGITIASGAVSSSLNESSDFYWFQEPHRFGWAELTDKNGEYMHRLFPVYSKLDTNTTGWYDIIYHQFYPQQWSAQGPDKEWE